MPTDTDNPTAGNLAWANITQDQVTGYVRRTLAEHDQAEAIHEAAQYVADAAQDRADEYERTKLDISARLNQFVDAVRANRPDLTIPEP